MSRTTQGQSDRQAVFIVSTPLQYINAREAVEVFDVEPATLVVPLVNYDRSLFERMDVQDCWSETVFVSRPHPEALRQTGWLGMGVRLGVDWFFYRRLGALARRLSPVDTLFIGHYDAYYQRHFTNRMAADRLVAVDDGVATVSIHRRRRSGPEPEYRPPRTHVRHALLGVDYREVPRLTLFTAYDLEEAHDRIVRNRYRHFRRRLDGSIRRNGEIWLLGQPAIVDSRMRLGAYVRCVRGAVGEYRRVGEVRYIPHPREQPETVSRVIDEVDVRLKETEGPIEWELATASIWPRRLAAFGSSAIQTCRKIFGDRLPTDVLCPDESVWDLEENDDVEDVFSMYRDSTSEPHRFVELSR